MEGIEKTEEKNEEKKDWASDLINVLLMTTKQAAEHIAPGFQMKGISLQTISKNEFSVNFQFKG